MRGFDTDKFVQNLIAFDPYLTAADVSFLMGRHANTILKAMAEGKIPVSTGPGTKPRVKLSALLEWGKSLGVKNGNGNGLTSRQSEAD
jgi:hypothetical protein